MADEVKKFVAPKRKKLLTRPVLKWVVGVTQYLKIEKPMHIGKDIKARDEKPDAKKKEPATLADVIDLQTGEPAQIIVNAVLKSVLNEEYPNDTYVDKCFAITKQARQPGKQYDPFSIEETEEPGESAGEETAAAAPASSAHTAAGKRR